MKDCSITVLALWTTLSVAVFAPSAQSAEIRMLSAGAVELGLAPVLDQFQRQSGHTVRVSFAAAPAIGPQIAADPGFDVVIAPPAVLDALAGRGTLGTERVVIGRVGIGIAVRANAATPDIANAETLTQELLSADAVVYNRASTGLYIEKLVRRLGIADRVDARAVRVGDGAAVMQRLLAGTAPRELGFGAITEIVLFRDRGIRLVGPLPAALQNFTTYTAAPVRHATRAEAPRPDAAVSALLQYLERPPARSTFAEAGIDAPR